MSDDARRAYVTSVRAHARGYQNAGFVACLIGVVVMLSGHYVRGAPHWAIYAGLLIILLGWGLFGFAIASRTAYARAHPFDPELK
jgi:hypothetical protein